MLAPSLIAEMLYVDSQDGSDTNPGNKEKPLLTIGNAADIISGKKEPGPTTIKIGAGVYNLTKAVLFENTRPYTKEERLTIEATILPDDPKWKPVLMPVILSTESNPAWKDSRYEHVSISRAFVVDVNHVTIRGLKFLGNPYPHNMHIPIYRRGRDKEDLLVTQCLFTGDVDTLPIHVPIAAYAAGVVVEYCIFYKCKNSVEFRGVPGKTNDSSAMRYCIVDGGTTSGVWLSKAEDFDFHNNIITRSNFALMRNYGNKRRHKIRDSIITENMNYSGQGVPPGKHTQKGRRWIYVSTGDDVTYDEKNVIKEGKVVLVKNQLGIDEALEIPRTYLHPLPGTLGSDLGAGLFKKLRHVNELRSEDSWYHTGQLEIQFIGNAAFHITDGQTTLLIDFPYTSGAYGYMEYKLEDVKAIKDGLSLITHKHHDHWDQGLFEEMGHAIIAPPDILENIKSEKKISFNDTMTYKDITIRAFETPHDSPAKLQHYSYLVTWHGLRLYIPGAAVVDYALTMKNIDIMFLGEWYTSKIQNQEIVLDAQTLIIFHQKEGQEIPSSPDYLVLKQGETIKVEFKEERVP
jgi:L-ascorbate metabolism protein UlaG (beta-lactamase superfamily)